MSLHGHQRTDVVYTPQVVKKSSEWQREFGGFLFVYLVGFVYSD